VSPVSVKYIKYICIKSGTSRGQSPRGVERLPYPSLEREREREREREGGRGGA